MASFDDYLEELKTGLKELARNTLKGFEKQATEDGRAFIEETKEDLQRWTSRLAKGELSKEDFEDLVLGQKELAKLVALKEAELARKRIQDFRNALVNLVIDTAIKVFI